MDNQTEQLKTLNNDGGWTHSQRLSNFEVLRIIAMVAIIFHHYFVHAQINTTNLSLLASIWYHTGISFGKFGVVVFVMISGYFSCTSRFNFKRLFLLWLEAFFYSVLVYCVLFATGQIDFSQSQFIANFFPIKEDHYWFVTCYLALMIVSPLLNILIKHLPRSRHFITCVVGMVLYSIIPTFFSAEFLYLNDLILFMLIYIFAAYLRKYGGLKVKIKTDILIIILSVLAMLVCKLIAIKIINGILDIDYEKNRLLASNSIFVLIMSAACVEVCAKSKPFTNKAVNYIAKSTFGVYLIHDNPFMREVLWCRIFKVSSFAEGNFAIFVLHSFLTVAIVFCCCTLIDIVRRFIEKPVSRAYDKLAVKLLNSRLAVKIKTFLHGLDCDE